MPANGLPAALELSQSGTRPARLAIVDAGHFVWEEAPAKYASAVLDSIRSNRP